MKTGWKRNFKGQRDHNHTVGRSVRTSHPGMGRAAWDPSGGEGQALGVPVWVFICRAWWAQPLSSEQNPMEEQRALNGRSASPSHPLNKPDSLNSHCPY